MFWNGKSKPNGPTANGKLNDDGSLIKLQDVRKIYETPAGKFTALKSVDLTIQRGEFVSIVGKSGSGKTTLINMLTGIDRPTKGEIFIGGTPVHQLDESQTATWRGTHLGVVFQFFQLLPMLTILENVRLPMDFCDIYTRPERNDRALALLELVGIAEHAHQLPNHVAGGQQQRAAIARALANDPPIIATDEPTGNLDWNTAESVMELFANLVAQGKTILMVTHDDDLAKRARRTIVIADGEIVNEVHR
jgi:putative ABC transport system ATP-binding protein